MSTNDHKEKLESLHQEAIQKFEEYARMKNQLGDEHLQQLHSAKTEWQAAWSKLMDVLLVLERIEI